MTASRLPFVPPQLIPPLSAVAIIVLIAILVPLLPLPDPISMDVPNRLAPASAVHWLGTDEYGRDVLSRIVWGARVTLVVSLSSSAIAGVIGVVLALIGGYFGGVAELLTVRVTDIVVSFPPILLALLVVTLLGPGAGTLILVLSVLYVPGFTRVTYGEVLSARAMDYVEASRALGADSRRIMLRTILPNVLPPILVQFSLTVAAAIVIESGLSFLGLGVVPPAPSWGQMIRGARSVMEQDWALLLWPSLALVFTIMAINQLCDALRDMFDPRADGLSRPALAAAAPSAPASVPTGELPLLSIRNLRTVFDTARGPVHAVEDVSFDVDRGEIVAVVGESGSGKSITGLSILGLVPRPYGRIAGGQILLSIGDAPRDLVPLSETELRCLRGRDVAMIFQEPMTALNPVHRIGDQIAEAVRSHRPVGRRAAMRIAVEMLEKVGIPDARKRARAYPHQLSGGMRQRAMIAMALVCDPSLLIADEPTTALDVTVQAEIVDLIKCLQRDRHNGMGVIFVTHNLGVVAEIADRVIVMYGGRVVEEADVRIIFRAPCHPYTQGLIASVPRPNPSGRRGTLPAIPGVVPSPFAMPPGCAFAPRCALREAACEAAMPQLTETGLRHRSRCRRWSEL